MGVQVIQRIDIANVISVSLRNKRFSLVLLEYIKKHLCLRILYTVNMIVLVVPVENINKITC
jgi:hypothetical protein